MTLFLRNCALQDVLDLLGRLRVEERDLAIEAAGALDIDVELVGPVGHQDEEHAAAVLGVAHELFDARDDARRRAAVAVAVAAAEGAIALVDDHDDLADGLDHGEDPLEIALGGADPLRAEVLELDRR